MNMLHVGLVPNNDPQPFEELEEWLTTRDYDKYYETWHRFDPDGTQYIRFNQLSDFLHCLDPPLRVEKPNKFEIVIMDIPICRDDMVFCVDILDAVIHNFYVNRVVLNEETREFDPGCPNEFGYDPVSSTLWRQRQEYCARLLQRAWRRYKRGVRVTK